MKYDRAKPAAIRTPMPAAHHAVVRRPARDRQIETLVLEHLRLPARVARVANQEPNHIDQSLAQQRRSRTRRR